MQIMTGDKVEIIFRYNWRTRVLGTFDDVTPSLSFKYFKQIYANLFVDNEIG